MTADGLRRVLPEPEIMEVSLRYAPGTDRADVARRLDAAYPAGVTDESPPPVPGPLVTLRDTDGLVRALGVFLTFLMLALTANALLAGVRNRAPDLAILRSLGFSSRQTNRSILWMSTTTVGLGLAGRHPARAWCWAPWSGAGWRAASTSAGHGRALVVPRRPDRGDAGRGGGAGADPGPPRREVAPGRGAPQPSRASGAAGRRAVEERPVRGRAPRIPAERGEVAPRGRSASSSASRW